jgi:hypothetical protein
VGDFGSAVFVLQEMNPTPAITETDARAGFRLHRAAILIIDAADSSVLGVMGVPAEDDIDVFPWA